MAMKMVKIGIFFSFSILLIASLAFSDGSSKTNQDCINGCHEEKETPLISCFNKSASYDIQEPWEIFLSADFLYWQAREDGLEYGISISSPSLGISNERVQSPDFKWHPGLKVGLGVDFKGHDYWDIFSQWTHLVCHNNTQASLSSLETINISLLQPIPFPSLLSATSARDSVRLIYNTIDLNLGRPFYSGKFLFFRPHAGLRGCWFKQTYNLNYEPLSVGAPYTSFAKFDSWGIGPRIGIESTWQLGSGFNILGKAAYSLLFTYFNVKQSRFISTLVSPFSSVKDSYRNNQVRSNIETSLGLSWGSYFDCNNWHVDLALEYEFQYWPSANKNLKFVDHFASGAFIEGGGLALHGPTLTLRLDF